MPKEEPQGFIERFRLLRPLGRGAQGVVYLAHDPELNRGVAIKTLTVDAQAQSREAEQLLAAAKTASSLSHPNIVPVFEVGLHAGHPFVVFEYVEGKTLDETLEQDGALPMGNAVIWMSQILAGMAHVHGCGLLHGDIKPANILIGANGIPRVTDFGISRPARAPSVEPVSAGTVQYMAPECFAQGSCDLRADVFSLGLVFHQMLTGEPVFDGANEYALIYRILHETPAPPSARNPRIDKRLDDIVLKALQRDPSERYADAGEMKRDLDRYRVPAERGKAAELQPTALHSTVEFLLRRMALKSDFPALSGSFHRINRLIAQGDDASLKPISDLVMRDFALTQKLLRVVNSAAYGNRKVTKVSDAISILGIGQLRSIATALMLSTGGRPGTRSPAVSAALTDAFVVGVLARNIGRLAGLATVEELFICGMFSRLGQLLSLFYLEDEHTEIERRIREERVGAAAASRAVLGLSFEQLGAEIARHWNFPELIVDAMRSLPNHALEPAQSAAERMWYCAGYARELCALARETTAPTAGQDLAQHIDRFGHAMPLPVEQVRALVGQSIEVALKYIAASGLDATRTALLDGLAALGGTAASSPQASIDKSEAPAPADDLVAMRVDTASGISMSPPRPLGWTGRIARVWRTWF